MEASNAHLPGEIVIWLDDSLLVVNKPAGFPSLPDGWNPSAPHLKSILEPVYGPLWIVHRLDRETSGVIVLARSAEAHRLLNLQFDQRLVTKIYHALVIGTPPWEEQAARMPLRVDVGRKHRTVVDLREGKPAVTNFRVLERFKCPAPMGGRGEEKSLRVPDMTYSLIEARPETGRTHQIRTHLSALGFPVAADALYGGEEISLPDVQPGDLDLLRRVALHACSLTLTHPSTDESVLFEAPYPDDFSNTLLLLRKYCRNA